MPENIIEAKVANFFGQYHVRHFAKGQVLIFSGDQTGYVYYLVSGKVKCYDVTHKGDEIILNVFRARSFFPMSMAINNAPNPYIYEAETDIDIRQAPAPEVVDFIKSNSDVLYDLLSRMYYGADAIIGRMARLMASNAQERLIYELVLEGRNNDALRPDGSCQLDIREKDLGALAGLSRETVSRELSKLKAENLVQNNRNSIITIINLKQLEAKLSQNI